MSTREKRSRVAKETLQILDRGYYINESGDKVVIQAELSSAVENTELYGPEELKELRVRSESPVPPSIDINNETTLRAARRLAWEDDLSPFVLNFASAKNPGGGFLRGSGAQEESLARKSGLYACIEPVKEYYERNRASGTGLYTDHMIYSPRVPVFRDRRDKLLDRPYYVSILTAPAVNRGAVKRNEPEKISKVRDTMDWRIGKVLKLAELKGHDYLVLGAWGCGVFGNDPREIASLFEENLLREPDANWGFERVVFAVLDRSAERETLQDFREVLG